jgi:hypothetical protein
MSPFLLRGMMLTLQLFKILLRLFQRSPVPDWSSMTIIWVQSRAAGPTVEALGKLVAAKDHAQAYQIAFDLYEIAPQGFVTEVRQGLVQSGLGPDQALVSTLLVVMESADESGRKRCP